MYPSILCIVFTLVPEKALSPSRWPGKGQEASKDPSATCLSSNSDAPSCLGNSKMTPCLQNVQNGRARDSNRIYDGTDHENKPLLSTDQRSPTPPSSAGCGVTSTSRTGNDLIPGAPNTVVGAYTPGTDTSVQPLTDQSPMTHGSYPRDSFEKGDIHTNLGSNHASIGTDVSSAGQGHERASHGKISYQSINNTLDFIASIPCKSSNNPSQQPSNVAAALSESGNGAHPDSPHDQSSSHLSSLNSLSEMSLHMSGGAANQALVDANQGELPVLVPSSDFQDEGLASIPYPLSFPEPSDPTSGSYPSYAPAADNVAVQGAMYAADSMPELNLRSGSGNGSGNMGNEDSHSSGTSYHIHVRVYSSTGTLRFPPPPPPPPFSDFTCF